MTLCMSHPAVEYVAYRHGWGYGNPLRIGSDDTLRIMEPNERLRQAREEAGYETAAEAARRFGWPVPAYRHHENGIRRFDMGRAETYAKAFRVSPEWLAFGRGTFERKGVPVVGYVGAGSEVFPFDDGGALDWVDAMPGIHPNAVAVIVRGDSMYPRYFDGDVLVYDEHISVRRANGQECVIALTDGRRLVKTVRATSTLVILESFNAAPIENPEIEWVAPILWVKRFSS